ncbi:MAG TPA: hypothetical protein PLG17_10780 [Thermodesulfobacteriota bacterium]|nr:hypothetical protein [Thermodesulfobacteriota bacterium]
MSKELAVRLKNSRQGTIMAQLPSGKLAFPVRGEKVPADAFPGCLFYVEVVQESDKYAFIRLIESVETRDNRLRREHCGKMLPLLRAAVKEFPNERRFAAALEGCVAGIWNGTAAWIESFRKECLQKEMLKKAADLIIQQLASWQEAEPPQPTFNYPAHTSVMGTVTAHTQWEVFWEGDGLRGRNDDGIRSATVHGYVVTVQSADVLNATADWPNQPQVKTLEITYGGIGEKQAPIGEAVSVSLGHVLRAKDYDSMMDEWMKVFSIHNAWDRKREIVRLAKKVDGIVVVPVEDVSGSLRTFPLDPAEVFAVEGPLSDWESYDSWLFGSAGD